MNHMLLVKNGFQVELFNPERKLAASLTTDQTIAELVHLLKPGDTIVYKVPNVSGEESESVGSWTYSYGGFGLSGGAS